MLVCCLFSVCWGTTRALAAPLSGVHRVFLVLSAILARGSAAGEGGAAHIIQEASAVRTHRPLLGAPRLHVLSDCPVDVNVSHLRSHFISGKRAEFLNEPLISDALRGLPKYSYREADAVVFDACPYYRHINETSDPYMKARKFHDRYSGSAETVEDQKPCVYMALHPASYPAPFHRMRFCTALVEDKTLSGDDEDVITPAGALKYPSAEGSARTCLLTFFGDAKRNRPEFAGVRSRVLGLLRSNSSKNLSGTCVASGTGGWGGEGYIRSIQRSKFCFALPGDTRGGEKLSMTIMNGCVPIVEYYSWRHLPFRSYLNYSKFAVRLGRDRDIHSLVATLHAINHTAYLSNVEEAQKWFDYTRRGPISPHALLWSEVADVWDIRRQ